MTIQIIDPGFDFLPLGIIGLILAVFVVLAIVGFKLSRGVTESGWYALGVLMCILATVAVMVGLLGGIGGGLDGYRERVRELKVDALEELGFERVTLDFSGAFTARFEDDFFDGQLRETDAPAGIRNFDVLEIVETK